MYWLSWLNSALANNSDVVTKIIHIILMVLTGNRDILSGK